MQEKDLPYMLKNILVIGGDNVGKWSIIRRLCDCVYREGEDSWKRKTWVKTMQVGDESVKLHIDQRNNNQFFFDDAIFRADAVVCVFSVTNEKSYENLIKNYLWFVDAFAPKDIPILFVGNKIDADKKDWEVSTSDVYQLTKDRGIHYIGASAKTGQNVVEIFKMCLNLPKKTPPTLLLKHSLAAFYHDHASNFKDDKRLRKKIEKRWQEVDYATYEVYGEGIGNHLKGLLPYHKKEENALLHEGEANDCFNKKFNERSLCFIPMLICMDWALSQNDYHIDFHILNKFIKINFSLDDKNRFIVNSKENELQPYVIRFSNFYSNKSEAKGLLLVRKVGQKDKDAPNTLKTFMRIPKPVIAMILQCVDGMTWSERVRPEESGIKGDVIKEGRVDR